MMLKKSYIYLILTVVALLAAACSKAPELTEPSVPVPDMTNLITFDMLGTKVTNEDITDEEFIIYDYVDGVKYIDGSKYTLKYSEGAWRFFENSSGNAVDFYWTETGIHEFFAYNKVEYYWYIWTASTYLINFTFEYNGAHSTLSTTSTINMLYPTDGSAPKGYSQDFIYAYVSRNVESEDGFGPVSLDFGHAFSSVQITVKNNSLVTKNIEDLMLSQIRCNTGTGAAPSIDFSGTVSFNSGELGDYPSSDKTLNHGDVWEVFDNPMVVLPQSVDHAVHHIQWTENGNYKYINIRDLETTSWDSGRLYHYVITLDPTELILAPTATIDTEDAGGNKFSVVNVNLNAPDGELQRITSLLITVTDPESNVIKTYEAATVDSNEISMECDVLLPSGTYTVSVAYHDGVESRSVSTTAVSEDTAVQPAVGYYVNSDGTFSETFVSGSSIAKIFYMGDLSSDTQFADDYPHCTRGLAYEVDPSTGLFKLNKHEYIYGRDVYESWGYGNCPMINWDTKDGYLYTYSNFHGFTNTVAIREYTTQGFMSAVDTSIPVVNGVTSSWYIPSVYEVKLIGKDTISAVDDTWDSYIWTSSISNLSANYSYACYYDFNTDKAKQLSDINDYNHRSYCRILAF